MTDGYKHERDEWKAAHDHHEREVEEAYCIIEELKKDIDGNG
jgi:hypothetical protein